MQIAVIDLGMGNLRSVAQALETVSTDVDIQISHRKADIEQADKVVLPGQGAIASWFNALQQRDLLSTLADAIQQKPLLGICVGMQALFDYCEEGDMDGLGYFSGKVRHFKHYHNAEPRLKIPQMGWNRVQQTQQHPLWQGIDNQAYFYFVHSYCANYHVDSSVSNGSEKDDFIVGEADYGHSFIAAAARDNVFAVQFHPEKSHRDGLQLLTNFIQWNGQC